MMRTRPGLIQSHQEALATIGQAELTYEDFLTAYPKIGDYVTAKLVEEGFRLGWIVFPPSGTLALTDRGGNIIAVPHSSLRSQMVLRDIVVIDRPAWASPLVHGRKRLLERCDGDELQCLQEAEFVGELDAAALALLDEMQIALRGASSDRKLETGRAAERMSLEYECNRTRKPCEWVAIEDNGRGYDLFSYLQGGSDERLAIEVKGSRSSLNSAQFFMSRREWSVAQSTPHHQTHLWLLHSEPRLFVVPPEELAPHISADQGAGQWNAVEVPYYVFEHCEVALP